MFSSGVTGGDLGSLVLSRIEQKSLYAAGVFFLLTIVFSAFSIASTIFSTVSLSGSLEKSIAAGMGVATAFVVAPLGYSIDRKATSTRKQGSRLVSTARLLLLEAVFGAAVCLAVIVAIAIGPLEHTYLSVLAGATLFVAGLFGCLFGAFFWMRAAKRAATESPGVQIQRTVAESAPVIASIWGRLKGRLPRLN